MLRKLIVAAVVIAVIGLAAFWLLTTPRTIAAEELPDHTPDLANGERMFWAAGCESCHSAEGAEGEELLMLVGGQRLVTPFGVFVAPNISSDPEAGIGDWSEADFVNAVKYGVAPDGTHLYPAFPYPSYQYMRMEDILDLKAFMDTLPAVSEEAPAHEVGFPFNIRRGVGLWKMLYANDDKMVGEPEHTDPVIRGAYLVRGPGHCGECHTPRNMIGGPMANLAYSGGPAPVGDGTIPNITPHESGIGGWSESEVVELLRSGFTPEFDSVGGDMAAVVRNTSQLPDEDLEAIAAYLKSLPPIASEED